MQVASPADSAEQWVGAFHQPAPQLNLDSEHIWCCISSCVRVLAWVELHLRVRAFLHLCVHTGPKPSHLSRTNCGYLSTSKQSEESDGGYDWVTITLML